MVAQTCVFSASSVDFTDATSARTKTIVNLACRRVYERNGYLFQLLFSGTFIPGLTTGIASGPFTFRIFKNLISWLLFDGFPFILISTGGFTSRSPHRPLCGRARGSSARDESERDYRTGTVYSWRECIPSALSNTFALNRIPR